MATKEGGAATAAAKPAPNRKSAVRTAIPYVIVASVAAAMLGWYFFSYVPGKLQYSAGSASGRWRLPHGSSRARSTACRAR